MQRGWKSVTAGGDERSVYIVKGAQYSCIFLAILMAEITYIW